VALADGLSLPSLREDRGSLQVLFLSGTGLPPSTVVRPSSRCDGRAGSR